MPFAVKKIAKKSTHSLRLPKPNALQQSFVQLYALCRYLELAAPVQ
jgi:hypothetical protein